jgi:hypothetical protein
MKPKEALEENLRREQERLETSRAMHGGVLPAYWTERKKELRRLCHKYGVTTPEWCEE